MTNIEIVMTPDEDKAIIRDAYIRRDKAPGNKYVPHTTSAYDTYK